MKQYNQIKVKYPDALLLFRVGDFYETFGEDAIKASKILGFKWIDNFDYPDNELDKIPLLSLIKKIEIIKKKINPSVIITHNHSDLNIDHRKIFEATLTAFRPEPKTKVEKILTFEVPSSTDFRILKRQNNFVPNFYVNIEKHLKFKIKATIKNILINFI